MDLVFVRCDDEGNFSADVIPGATYCVAVEDSNWISEPWTGILSEVNDENPLELKLVEGEPVEIMVTGSPGNVPLEGVRIELSSDVNFNWKEDGATQSGSMGRSWSVVTDKYGKATTHASVGELSAYVQDPNWRPDFSGVVEAGKMTDINFRKPMPKRMLAGTIASSDSGVVVENSEIKLFATEGQLDDKASTTAQADGKFEFEMAGDRIVAFAKSNDGKYFGATVADVTSDPLELDWRPTVTYAGSMVDEDDAPLVGKWVRLIARMKDPDGKRGRFNRNYVDVETLEVKTDAAGKFEFSGVPTEIELHLRYESDEDPKYGEYVGKRYLVPGQNRPAEMIRVVNSVTPAPPLPLVENLQNVTDNCRRAGINVLVIVDGAGENVSEFIRTYCYDDDETKALLSYLPLWIGGAMSKSRAERENFLKAKGWEIPDDGNVFLAVVDGKGKTVAKLTIECKSDSSPKLFSEFVGKHARPKGAANEKLAKALKEANDSGRKVWIRFSQTRCAPCFTFAKWLEEQEELLDRDYVMLKIDVLLDEGGWELEKNLGAGDNFGVPNFFILDTNGQPIISSAGPTGNIGDPSEFEGYLHLRKMIESTSEKLTPNQIDKLIESKKSSK